MILAAIDIGTNSVRLLVAKKEEENIFPLKRCLVSTRLGKGLVKSGFLSPEGRDATIKAVCGLKQEALDMGAEFVVIAGTSAMREAVDGREFALKLGLLTGQDILVLSAAKEAECSYTGVTRTLQLQGEAVIFDLGGGSCEFICAENGSLRSDSMNIGAVYLTETFFSADPPGPNEIKAARVYVQELLSDFKFSGLPLVGVGGTVTSLAAMDLEMEVYDPERIHGYSLSLAAADKLFAKMCSVSVGLRKSMKGLQAERADILPAGALVVTEILRAADAGTFLVSEGDLLTGCLFISSA